MSLASVKTKILLAEETESVGNKIVNRLEEALAEFVDGKERCIGDITRLDDEQHWIHWVNKYGQRLELSIQESPMAVMVEHLTKITVILCYEDNRNGITHIKVIS
jgi:desulfoferrodoxin (superoxide reductase-like protein)